MRPFVHWFWVVVVALGAVAAGWVAGTVTRGSAPPTVVAESQTLSLTAAGTLGIVFPQLASWLANATPPVQAPLAAQQYTGSLTALAAISQLHQSYDVAASADFRLIPQLLEPEWAHWEAVFATSPEVLAYDPSASAFQGVNGSNWASRIESPGVLLGVANASTDPNGYNGIFVLELEGLVLGGSLSSVYGHFYTTPVGSLAIPNPQTTRVEPETQAATLLATHAVTAFIIYRSYATAHHLAFVSLDPNVGLGVFNATAAGVYAQASTAILTATGTHEVRGAPVGFAATVPANAPNATLGAEFVDLLFSPVGVDLLASAGLTPIVPGYADVPSSVPWLVAADVVPFPAWLSSANT